MHCLELDISTSTDSTYRIMLLCYSINVLMLMQLFPSGKMASDEVCFSHDCKTRRQVTGLTIAKK
jgi:hypothetical protein